MGSLTGEKMAAHSGVSAVQPGSRIGASPRARGRPVCQSLRDPDGYHYIGGEPILIVEEASTRQPGHRADPWRRSLPLALGVPGPRRKSVCWSQPAW